MMAKECTGYVAVRKATDDGHEWYDVTTFSGLIECTRSLASQTDARLRSWANANPVVRIATVRIEEVIA